MILVGQLDSPFVRRVAVTLDHYGTPFERRPLSVFSDLEDLKTINPLGKVPALTLDDGETLFDSQMILDHLDEAAGPERALTPPDGAARRRVLRLVTMALGVAEKVVALNVETRRRAEGTVDPAIVDRSEGQVASGLAWLETQAPDPWLIGAEMTQADVTAACVLTHLHERRGELFPPDVYPALAALRERAEGLPGFQAYPFRES